MKVHKILALTLAMALSICAIPTTIAEAKGYEIVYSTNVNFTKKTTKKISTKNLTKTIKKLKKKKKTFPSK